MRIALRRVPLFALAAALTLRAVAAPAQSRADALAPVPGANSFTIYAARISSEKTWQHLLKDPLDAGFVDSWLLVGAVAREYRRSWGGRLTLGAELQLARHFGEQSLWEVNAVPALLRWHQWPWSESLRTTLGFGLGLSYASEVPEVELRLEDTSERAMVYWVLELAGGARDAPWDVVLRLHHRSDAFGLMGEDGGMNAVGVGVRRRF